MHQNQKFAVDVQGACAVFPYVTCVDQLLCGQSLHVKEARCVCLSYEPSLQKLWHAGTGRSATEIRRLLLQCSMLCVLSTSHVHIN